MNKTRDSILKRLGAYNYSFGFKLRLTLLTLIISSLLITCVVGLYFFRNYIYVKSNQNLEISTSGKQTEFEDFYSKIKEKVATITDNTLASNVEALIKGYDNYLYDFSAHDKLPQYEGAIQFYYQNEVIDKINFHPPTFDAIKPTDKKVSILQYNYLVNNSFKAEEKYRLDKFDDGTSYSQYHKQIHGTLHKIATKLGFNNIYIIDSKKGDVIYTYNKNIVFGNNLFSSYLKNTQLITAYQRALIANDHDVVPIDYDFFIGTNNQPVAFLATPIIYNGKKNAVLVFEINSDFFSPVLLNKNETETSFCLVGKDKKIRNKPIEEQSDAEGFKQLLRKHSIDGEQAIQVGTSALSLSYGFDLNLGEKQNKPIANYLGEKSFIQSSKLNIKGIDWYLTGQQTVNSTMSEFKQIFFIILAVFFGLIMLSIFTANFFKKMILPSIGKLQNAMQKIAVGEKQENLNIVWHDEIGNTMKTFNELNSRIDEAGKFALLLSEGKYDLNFEELSENDLFAHSLNTLKQALKSNKAEEDKRTEEDQIRNWTNEGIAMFNDLLRQSNDNIDKLAYIIIENLIKHVNANIGGVFLVKGEQDSEKTINLIASYAYDRRKYEKKVIAIGEGIIGNCYLEKKPVFLRNIPQDYMEIGTGMGKASPKIVYISPLIYDDEVLGFIELASLEEFKQYEVEFIDKLSENIAATFSTVRLNTKTAILLEESERRTNEIAQQEEEMRQNLEEMQATQEELARLRDEDEKRTKMLQDEIESSKSMIQEIVNNMSGEVYIKNQEGVIVLANEEIAARFNTTPEKLMGKVDTDIFTQERAEKEQELDKLVLTEGIFSDELSELVGTEQQTYFIVKKPFYFPVTKETGVITIRNKR